MLLNCKLKFLARKSDPSRVAVRVMQAAEAWRLWNRGKNVSRGGREVSRLSILLNKFFWMFVFVSVGSKHVKIENLPEGFLGSVDLAFLFWVIPYSMSQVRSLGTSGVLRSYLPWGKICLCDKKRTQRLGCGRGFLQGKSCWCDSMKCIIVYEFLGFCP